MLTSLYRTGPLKQRTAKAYVVADPSGSRTPAQWVRALLDAPPRIAAPPGGGGFRLRAHDRWPDALWLDPGPLSLHDPLSRAEAARSLAHGVATVAHMLRSWGAMLLPAGWHPGGDSPSLAHDAHALEVAGPVHRELLHNLVRRHSATLIALSARPAYGPHRSSGAGSARLARADDQVALRYVDSFSPQHVRRLTADLSTDRHGARLDTMDALPLGDPLLGDGELLGLRLLDAQACVSTTMAHALLVQALAMQARDMERRGQRVPVVPQQWVERNRARAVADGMAAQLVPDRKDVRDAAAEPAAAAVLALLRELLPYLRQLDATADELAPLFLGPALADTGGARVVRGEADAFTAWQARDAQALDPGRLAVALTDAQWLLSDQLTATNAALLPGSTSAARLWLAGELTPRPAARGQEKGASGKGASRTADSGKGASRTADSSKGSSRTDGSREDASGKDASRTDGSRPGTAQSRPRRLPREQVRPVTPLTAEQLLDIVGRDGLHPADAAEALRSYARNPGALDLDRRLRGDGGRAARRVLRPRRALRTRCTEPIEDWGVPPADAAVGFAREHGVALLEWEIPAQERQGVRRGLARAGGPPEGLRYVVLTDARFTDKGQARGRVEVLLVAPGEEPREEPRKKPREEREERESA